jgi:TrmH family RNA methyltransferase
LLRSTARRTARCVVEGWRAVETAVASGAEIHLFLHTPDAGADPHVRGIAERLQTSGARVVVVSPYVFASLSQVESPQGVLAVARRPPGASPDVLSDPRALLAVLDGVQDPGNVGAILRTAAAAGATGALIAGATADPCGSKAIRAAAGAVFHLPLLSFKSAPDAARALVDRGVRILIADPRGHHLHSQVSYTRPLAIVFGGEGAGVDPVWGRHGTGVRLPMAGGMESLNVAAAAAVLLYRAVQEDEGRHPSKGL